MKIAMIAFTARGYSLSEQLMAQLEGEGHEIALAKGFGKDKQALHAFAEHAMAESTGIVFIGATGIAVRAIAPYLRDKWEDPAVVVVDECGRYAIPLLSGHVGGANDLALRIAWLIGAQPIITTATDGRDVFAVDVWAKAHALHLRPQALAKDVSAALLSGEPVGFASDFPLDGKLPDGFSPQDAPCGLYVGLDIRKKPFERTLQAIPKVLIVGIGCRRGIDLETLAFRVHAALEKMSYPFEAVCAVHSIDIKQGEPGLRALCNGYDWPFRTFSAEALQRATGHFTASSFVAATVGVDNVCERAAVMTGGTLRLPKQAGDGVTVAISALPYTVSM